MDLKDPGNNPGIAISSNGREVKLVPNQNISCQSCNNYVWGSQAIKSGKYYWEVDVSNKTEWVIGVRQITPRETSFQFQKKTPPRPGLGITVGSGFYSQSQNSMPYIKHVCSKYEPKFGYWVIERQYKSMYKVVVNSSDPDPEVLTLSMTVHPRRIGVFVDCKAHRVSFYNVTHHGFLIYQFTSCHFTKELVPYFNLKSCYLPMKLCSPNS